MGAEGRRIRIVVPIVSGSWLGAEEYERELGSETTQISVSQIERGPASIENAFDAALAVPDTLRLIGEAERDGIDAVVIDCMDDPGLEPARELVSIPVVGPCEASMHLAAMLGRRFSVITVPDERSAAAFEDHAEAYGVSRKLASVRWVDIPVLELGADPDGLVKALVAQAARAVEDDRADVIVFGCTGMFGDADRVQEGLRDLGYEGIPVIDPIPTAVRMAEALIDLRLTHSARSYPSPHQKPVVGFEPLM